MTDRPATRTGAPAATETPHSGLFSEADRAAVGGGRAPIAWWTDECGLRDVIRLAVPLVISNLSLTMMHFCDRMFMAWYSTTGMGAVMNGAAVVWTSIALPLGIAMYGSTFVAQYVGAGQRDQLGKVLGALVRLTLLTTPLFVVFAAFTPTIFAWFRHEPELASLETVYVQLLCFGSPAAVLGAALASIFIGQGRTRLVMFVDMIAALVNVGLDYVMIFGYLGFPEGGIKGAAWATVIAMWCKPAMLVWALQADRDRAHYRLREGWKWDWPMLAQLLKFGGPSGLQILQEASSFTLFLMFVGQLGSLANEATTMSININIVAFVPILGIGVAVTTLVGQQIGAGRPGLAERATRNGLILAVLYAGVFGAIYLLFPHTFMSIYRLDRTNQAELYDTAVVLLRFVAAYCILDAVQLVYVSAIKGAGDTWFAMMASLALTVVFIGSGWLGALWFPTPREQLLWWWSCLAGWIWLLSVTFYARFRVGRWKSMSVIDQS